MPGKQSIRRRGNVQPIKQKLSFSELQRVAEKLACALENDSNSIALVTLMFEHLEQQRCEPVMLSASIGIIKERLFCGTPEAGDAQRKFQEDAFKNRGKLLLWPNERKGAA